MLKITNLINILPKHLIMSPKVSSNLKKDNKFKNYKIYQIIKCQEKMRRNLIKIRVLGKKIKVKICFDKFIKLLKITFS
jgi:hypothetical protein